MEAGARLYVALALAHGWDFEARPDTAWLRQLPAVQALRVMLIQNYVRVTDGKGRDVIKRRESLEAGG